MHASLEAIVAYCPATVADRKEGRSNLTVGGSRLASSNRTAAQHDLWCGRQQLRYVMTAVVFCIRVLES